MEFTKNNLPELLRYLAGYMEKHPDCQEGFGLETRVMRITDKWDYSGAGAGSIISNTTIGFTYRIKPTTRMINGVECPVPLSEEPEQGTAYYVEDPAEEAFTYEYFWSVSPMADDLFFKRGICYATPEAAAMSCKARYGVK
jgi:hypothetical protein